MDVEGNMGLELRPQKPLRLTRDGEVGGGEGIFISNTYSLHCYRQKDSAGGQLNEPL